MAFGRPVLFGMLSYIIFSLSRRPLTEFARGYVTEIGYSRRVLFLPSWLNWVNRLFLPATDHWYHVRFYEAPDLPALGAMGIPLKGARRIASDFYALYLSRDNASFILQSKLAELGRVGDKMDVGKIPLSKAEYLVIDTAPGFDIKDFPSIQFSRLTYRSYIASSEDLERAAMVLSKSRPVYAIIPAKHIVPVNWYDQEWLDSPDVVRLHERVDEPEGGELEWGPLAGFREQMEMLARGEFDTSDLLSDEELRAVIGVDDEDETKDTGDQEEM
jgi:hypothetical protein